MEKQVVIITGASSGIGYASALKFLSTGNYRLVMAARSIDNIDLSPFEKYKSDILTIKTDVSVESDCKNLINTTISTFGRIDILINNAGISMRALFKDVDIKVIKRLMDVNFWGTVYCTKYALPHLLKTKGSVVVVSSIAGFKGLPARMGYTTSKYALHGFVDVLRNENLGTGLHVMLFAPGFTTSNIRNTALLEDGTPQGSSPRKEEKMMTSEKVAEYLYNAVLKRKRQVILTPIGKATVFINKLFPKFVDKKIFQSFVKEPNSPLARIKKV